MYRPRVRKRRYSIRNRRRYRRILLSSSSIGGQAYSPLSRKASSTFGSTGQPNKVARYEKYNGFKRKAAHFALDAADFYYKKNAYTFIPGLSIYHPLNDWKLRTAYRMVHPHVMKYARAYAGQDDTDT
jgi:hypothetical protein